MYAYGYYGKEKIMSNKVFLHFRARYDVIQNSLLANLRKRKYVFLEYPFIGIHLYSILAFVLIL